MPPLGRRMQDIPDLLTPLLKRYNKALSCITPSMFERIQSYHWPGNIRELNSLMESYLILLGSRKSDERLFNELLEEYRDPHGPVGRQPSAGRDSTPSPAYADTDEESGSRTLKQYLENQKKKFISQTLHRCGNSRTLAAKRLGISTNTLWRALKKAE